MSMMTRRSRAVLYSGRWALYALLSSGLGCAGVAHADEKKPSTPAPTHQVAAAGGAPAPAATPALDPAKEKAAQLREAASLLEKAGDALARGNKSFAEQLFSSAELIVGPDAVADLASRFREGAPPRVNTPLKTIPDAGKQPVLVGNSDEDEPEKKPEKGVLTGSVQIEGKGTGAVGVITLEPVGKKWPRRAAKQRVVEQRNREFLPHVTAVPVGSTVSFPNYDPTFHNVFSSSESKPFDLGLYKGGQARDVTFDKEGVVRIGCNLHANMSAFIVVVAAPHYAITDENGNFKFGSLAPGKYTLRAWSDKSTTPVTQEITIKVGTNQVAVGVKADAPAGPAPDKFGVARGSKK
jgi:plastocyanin